MPGNRELNKEFGEFLSLVNNNSNNNIDIDNNNIDKNIDRRRR